MSSAKNEGVGLRPFLSPITVLAFAVGTSVGWGSLVVTSNTYLKQAGPIGSSLGLIISMFVMLLVCRNYHYLENKNTDGLGVYSYAKHVFGYDRAFLISWFVFLLYISILWANATAVPLFARYIFGDFFRFGYLYSVFGYEIYIGEMLLTGAVIALTALLTISSKRFVAIVMTVLFFVFFIGISVCFAVAVIRNSSGSSGFKPAFIPDGKPVSQIANIAFISPWAFIGFESVTHSSKEFNFKKTKLFRILTVSVVITTVMYIFIILLSTTAYPSRYQNWLQYINDLDNLSGIEALPAFYAAAHYLGNTGLVILFSSLFALVATSLIANTWVLSRLMYAVGQDSIIPERYARLNKKGIPARAILFVAGISLLVPFLGRSAIGWIVDVTTIIATLLYGFVSMATIKCAKKNKDKREFTAGIIVLSVMILFGAALLLPGLNSSSLEPETYLLFILWCIFGMIFFHRVIGKDHARHFGKAIIVWIVFVTLIIFLGIVWMDRISDAATHRALDLLGDYHTGTASPEILALSEAEYVSMLNKQIDRTSLMSIYAVLALFAVAVGGFISNYFFMKKYEKKLEKDVEAKTEHIVNIQNDLVVGMAAMVESRDNSTGGHIKRTSEVVRILVEEMDKDDSLDISEKFYETVIKAAPMHDLGKIAVDDVILRKPGKYTPEEFEKMKTHAKEGAKIVSEILKNTDDEDFKRIAENMAHYHHERYDGTGYPENLKGDEIPFEARIMSVADVYDALVSKRVYKEKMTFDEADKIILSGMGTQFDGKLEKYYIKARPMLEEYYRSL